MQEVGQALCITFDGQLDIFNVYNNYELNIKLIVKLIKLIVHCDSKSRNWCL